jgi:hypothetical protein
MDMATMDVEPAAVNIPGAYLEDVRSALAKEIERDGAALRGDQVELVAAVGAQDIEFHRGDRDGAVDRLGKDLRLLEQLRGVTGEMKLTGDVDTLSHTLEATVHVLNGRLETVCQYAPLPMGDVIELSARLRWAADEAIRLCPDLAQRLADDDKAVA